MVNVLYTQIYLLIPINLDLHLMNNKHGSTLMSYTQRSTINVLYTQIYLLMS